MRGSLTSDLTLTTVPPGPSPQTRANQIQHLLQLLMQGSIMAPSWSLTYLWLPSADPFYLQPPYQSEHLQVWELNEVFHDIRLVGMLWSPSRVYCTNHDHCLHHSHLHRYYCHHFHHRHHHSPPLPIKTDLPPPPSLSSPTPPVTTTSLNLKKMSSSSLKSQLKWNFLNPSWI